jgi:type I restriction-modification system DNA methylase subunit/REP element-mobilizing transposase RayT
MGFYQSTVLNKYLQVIDAQKIQLAYSQFKAHFHNPLVQQNIRASKEEQYQEGFFRDLFVEVLGYTLNPNQDFNLTTEYKNVKDSKKADGAIVISSFSTRGHAPLQKIKAVIELKGTSTTDLDKIEAQAFGYKNNQPECTYVIISNFEKLRFYIDNAIEYIEFNLFTLTEKEFELLWICLSYESIAADLPKKIKNASLSEEDTITKKLYKDYSLFKRELHQNLVALNPNLDALLLFKKSQKLLDRFLFLFFAEDRHLLPPNSVRAILNQWNELKDMDAYAPLYNRFKMYFVYLNSGHKGKYHDVFAYNGGLFKLDDVLDAVIIDDELLYRHTLKLSEYDFASEVDVNILGHIFENSLNELDEINAQLSGEKVDKNTTKRKKDGVFYTPKFTTKYIVDNTVGKLCSEKRTELGINEEDYTLNVKEGKLSKVEIKALNESRKPLLEKLTAYREWLLHITICDPACGSGAFLVEALDFLIREHRFIDELQAKLFGDALVLSDVEKSILENNLFGVDINEESVEIAKLSLWLRTAQPNRKLNDLNNNIKCGNSLIDNPAVAGEKAFNWQVEFPQVFRRKEKKAWHVTTATHNSRYSQRMFDNYVKLGEPVWLSGKEEVIVTKTIAEIVENDKLNVLAYNVCGDHLHIALVCDEKELSSIVGKIKSMSARAVNVAMGRTTRGHAPLSDTSSSVSPSSSTGRGERGETQTALWTQKFGCKEITSDEQLQNTINYIRNNRVKHGLPELSTEGTSTEGASNKGACPLVFPLVGSPLGSPLDFPRTVSPLVAFRTEYKGGFDVVIGNPPYVQLQTMGEMSEILKSCGFETYEKGADLYCLFTERGYKLLKKGGIQSFIMPNKWMLVAYGKPLRKFLSGTGLQQILNFGDIQFFQEATTYVCIFVTQKINKPEKVKVLSLNQKTYNGDFLSEVQNNTYDYPSDNFSDSEWSIQPYEDAVKLNKMKLNGTELKNLAVSIYRGILTGYNDAFYINEATKQQLIASDPKSEEIIKPMVRGRDITAYEITDFEYLIGTFPALKLDIDDYPAIKEHLLSFGFDRLNQTGVNGARKKTSGKWFETQDSIGYYKEFAKPKIIYPNMTSVFPFMYDESGMLGNQKCFILTALDSSVSLLYLTAVFNSSLSKLWIWYNCPELQGGTREISKVYFEHFPVPQANAEQISLLEQFARDRIAFNNELQPIVGKFQRMLQRKFDLEELPGKLQNWYSLTYKEFVAELGKKKVKLTLPQEAEWEDYFTAEQTKVLEIKKQIDTTDKKIDMLVYELYGLTEVGVGE